LSKNTNQNQVNVLSLTHPETGQRYYTPECDVIFRNVISKSENTILPQKFAEGILEKEIGEVSVNENRDFDIDSVTDKEMESDVKMFSKNNNGIYIFEMQTSAPKDITIHVIELPKYIEHKKKTNEMNIWLEYIINPLGEEVREAMRTKEELRLAVDMLNLLNSDDQVREIALKEILDDMDRNSEINDSREEGRAEGKAEGKAELIKEMLEHGVSMNQIAEMLNIETSEIEEMLKCVANT